MQKLTPAHSLSTRVSFGDCDPAGIVFYPNILAWFDRAFHDWLWSFGGHDALCARLGAVGIGLMDVSARFHRPLRNGDVLTIGLTVEDWGAKTVRLAYELRAADALSATGTETRGLFVRNQTGIVAASLDSLRKTLESHEK